MHIAVVGCGHGEIDKIYETIASIEQRQGIKVSLLLCCGDFQSVRNMTDLRCMACPIKYQQMHDFHRYYSGEKKAPIVTLFIGGNHEASNFLQELPFGGWVAPNIYYLGYAGVVRYGPVKIAGISGIYKGQDYLKGRYEAPPYDQGTMRSVYHYRNLDIFRMKQLKQPVDIVLSHDWPKGVHQFGDFEQLLRRKPFFRDELERNELGSRPLFEMLEKIQPSYWFSAHMHVKFAAYVPHTCDILEDADNGLNESVINESSTSDRNTSSPKKFTKFLALDKVLPRRQFLQVLEIPSEGPIENFKLEHDPEWLSILKLTNHLVSSKATTCFMPGPGCQSRYDFTPTKGELDEILDIFQHNLEVPLDGFTQTGPIFQLNDRPQRAFPIRNPQTQELCNKLNIEDPLCLAAPESYGNPLLFEKSGDSNRSCDNSFYESQMDVTHNRTSYNMEDSLNPDEISLDLEEENQRTQQTKDDENDQKPSSLRSKLSLPPPKCSDSNVKNIERDNDSVDGQECVSQEELQLLKSVMGDVDDSPSSSAGFFIDTQGDEPVSKRRKDESFRY